MSVEYSFITFLNKDSSHIILAVHDDILQHHFKPGLSLRVFLDPVSTYWDWDHQMPGAGLLSPATRVSAPRFKSRTVPVLGPHWLTRDLSECFGIERLAIIMLQGGSEWRINIKWLENTHNKVFWQFNLYKCHLHIHKIY